MKRIFILFSFLSLFISIDGQVNLGTVYFQNPQYLVSFDKVMYPGYKIALENFTVREYLMNTKISEKLLAKKIESSYSEGMDFVLEDAMIENWMLMAKIKLNEKFEISEETYDLVQYSGATGEELHLAPILSKTSVFKRANGRKVEEVQIENTIDMETNKISSVENVLNTRKIKSDEVGDINGNVYRTVVIGGQRWMAENLRATSFSNGDVIPFLNESQWASTASSGLVELNSEGNYYNFYSMIDERNVCPAGFWIPGTWNIENLYNTITPYSGKTKITANSVKQRVYPRLLAPIIAPISIGANAALYSASVAIDLAYTVPWVLIDGLILGPIFGWETVKEQKRKAKKGTIDSLAQYKLKYTPFPTAQDNIGFFATTAVADGVGLIPILPYYEVSEESYPQSKFYLNSESLSYNSRYQPVLTFLLEKGKEEVFSDPFGFSLNFDNNIKFPKSFKSKETISVGLTYDDGEVPQVWGIGKKINGHELRSFYLKDQNQDAKKMSTRIRCVGEEDVDEDSDENRKD
jgi:hypothetical protein